MLDGNGKAFVRVLVLTYNNDSEYYLYDLWWVK